MKEFCRKIKAFALLAGVVFRLPAWAMRVLADSIRRAGGSEEFNIEIGEMSINILLHELVKLQQKAYEIQKSKESVKQDV